MRLLIRSSLTTQEQASVAAHGLGSGRRALVIGGAGKMGGWFAQFLSSQGFEVEIADPRDAGAGSRTSPTGASSAARARSHRGGRAAGCHQHHPAAARAAPAARHGVRSRLAQVAAARRADGAAHAGVAVTSLHPMFGPDTELLSGRHVIFIDLGSAEALREARALFAPTMAEQVVMDLDEHDRLIAYVLGLSHALNIAFFTALARERRGGAAPGAAVEHHLRCAVRHRQQGGRGESGALLRDPAPERLSAPSRSRRWRARSRRCAAPCPQVIRRASRR